MKDSHFKSIFDSTSLGVAVYEANSDISDFKIIYINSALEKIELVKKHEIIGKNVTEIFPGIKEFGLFDIFIKVLNSGEPERFPTAFYKDGRISGWRDNHVSKLSGDRVVTIYAKESNRSEKNKPSKEYEYFYRTIFETIQDGITVLDNELNIIKMNQAMERWYSPQKPYVGKKCYNIYHKKESACEGCPAKKAIDTGMQQTKIVNRGGPLGTPGWIELSAYPIVNDDGYTVGAVEYVRNITARKTAEDDLKNSEKKLREIIDFLPDPTWVINKDGIIIQWNRAIELLTNRKASEMLGKGNYEHAIPFFNERKPMLIDIALDPKKIIETDYKHLEKNDDVLIITDSFHKFLGKEGVYISATATPLYNKEGDKIGAIETVHDITELKQLQIEKEKQSKKELNNALSKLNMLSKLITICSSCKKIKDDSGFWSQLELFIQSNSDIKFSHGLCNDCAESIYGNEDWYIKRKSQKN